MSAHKVVELNINTFNDHALEEFMHELWGNLQIRNKLFQLCTAIQKAMAYAAPRMNTCGNSPGSSPLALAIWYAKSK